MPEPVQPRSIAVAMAVHQDPGTLRDAVACMRDQSIATSRNWRLAIWLVCNGADVGTREAVAGLASEINASGSRSGGVCVIVRELERASLAAALNVVLRESDAELVARMDADDLCPLDRLARQIEVMDAHPEAAACFCAWESRDASGATVQRFDAVEDARLVPWLLLMGNPFAHGSALLRRDAVVAAGGYNESFPRAQDYDLWLRLSERGAIVSARESLYFHRIRHAGQGTEGPKVQAVHAARARMEAMSRLRTLRELHGTRADAAMARLHEVMGEVAMGAAFAGDDRALVAKLIEASGEAPTREAVDAMLWARGVARAKSDEAERACFAACVREKWRQMRDEGVREVALWGAGRHTARLLEVLDVAGDGNERLGTPRVRRVVDDHANGQIGALVIQRPEVLRAGDAVLISSDAHEASMWERSRSLRDRGVNVYRLYGT